MTEQPHDALFKRIFGDPENAAGELRSVFPQALVDEIDFSTLQPAPTELLDEDLQSRHSDLLFSVRLSGRSTLIYLLMEHQSSEDSLLPLRILCYIARIWERWLRESKRRGAKEVPWIIPMVLYHGSKEWTAPTDLHTVLGLTAEQRTNFGRHIPQLDLLFDDLVKLLDEQILERAMPSPGRLTALTFKHARENPNLPERMMSWRILLREMSATAQGLDALETICKYIIRVSETVGIESLAEVLRNTTGEETEGIMPTIGERLIAEGHEKGLAKGLGKGKVIEARNILMRQLGIRFGELPAEITERIESADLETIHTWLDKLLTVSSLADLFPDLPSASA